jgi:hypothetical protein
MARSEAQKAADKRYRETHKANQVSWTAKVTPEELQEYDALLKENNLGKTQFLRMAFENYKKTIENNKN